MTLTKVNRSFYYSINAVLLPSGLSFLFNDPTERREQEQQRLSKKEFTACDCTQPLAPAFSSAAAQLPATKPGPNKAREPFLILGRLLVMGLVVHLHLSLWENLQPSGPTVANGLFSIYTCVLDENLMSLFVCDI